MNAVMPRVWRRVWIDTDLGFDDLAAVLALQHAPGVQIVGMSLVAGNAPMAVVRANAQKAAACFGWGFPIIEGASQPLEGDLITAQAILGGDAMRSAGRGLPDVALPVDMAQVSLKAALAALPEPVEVLALGPLTNLAHGVGQQVRSITWMGGSAGAGNHTAAAEFNALVDPEAVQQTVDACTAQGVPFRMVGLDACRQVRVWKRDADDLRKSGTDHAERLADLLLGYVGIANIGDSSCPNPMSLYDPTAAALWLQPGLCNWRPARIDVELMGHHTRGMTVCEFRVPRKAQANAEVAGVVDEAVVRTVVLHGLHQAARWVN